MVSVAALCGALAVSMAGCDSDEDDPDQSASSQSGPGSGGSAGDGAGASGGQGASGAQGGAGGSGAQGGGGGGGPCPTGSICLDVIANMGGPIEPARVAVVWYQLDDDGPDPTPLVAYDVAFLGNESRVDIPIADIGLPDEPNLLCARACDDEATCPCLSEPKVGIGAVLVAKDINQDGALDAAEALEFHGIGFMAVGYSETEFLPAPLPFDAIFPEGIDAGVRPYRIIDTADSFDDLGRTVGGEVFELDVCNAPSEACDPNGPNLT
jgi:hypothetical protein